ncbi:hypothetical protein TcasGA2_TC002677 [Tribolium castaneum]|uniref:Uncharacterized protein n=1 Tax=Tribolium castaneum TaxID=7070 RepID=D6WEB8_TRICA|nr:hypothetical protein TcasGA2_TC002677 [Tribolium castaneum]
MESRLANLAATNFDHTVIGLRSLLSIKTNNRINQSEIFTIGAVRKRTHGVNYRRFGAKLDSELTTLAAEALKF